MEYKFTPEVDKENFTISFGMAKDLPLIRKYTTVKKEFDLLCRISDIHDRRIYGKEFYKKYTEVVGITPSATIKLLAKFSWKELLCGFDKKQVYRWCYSDGFECQPMDHKFKSLMNNKHHIEQALADNQENLVPFILRMNMSPKQIKDSLTKAEWKTIINNSFTRNKLLSDRRNWKELLTVNSTVLKYSSLYDGSEKLLCVTNYLVSNRGLTSYYTRNRFKSQECRELSRIVGIIDDTVSMATELGEPINRKWGAKRWEEEHNRIQRIYNIKDFTDVEITRGLYPQLPKVIEKGGYKAILLTTPKQVATEGHDMGHCVASYAGRCQRGDYIVYSILSDKGVRSTLGLHGDGRKQQHYARYNKYPDEGSIAFGEFVSEVITKGETNDQTK